MAAFEGLADVVDHGRAGHAEEFSGGGDADELGDRAGGAACLLLGCVFVGGLGCQAVEGCGGQNLDRPSRSTTCAC